MLKFLLKRETSMALITLVAIGWAIYSFSKGLAIEGWTLIGVALFGVGFQVASYIRRKG